MDKTEFINFCKEEFYKRGFRKVKSGYYLDGNKDIQCAIFLQKSNFGNCYYVNCCFNIKGFNQFLPYPTYNETDIDGRIGVLSKKSKKEFITDQIYYEDYEKNELRLYFDKAFDEWIFPPLKDGKKFILDNLNIFYSLTINADKILNELQNY